MGHDLNLEVPYTAYRPRNAPLHYLFFSLKKGLESVLPGTPAYVVSTDRDDRVQDSRCGGGKVMPRILS